MAGPLMRLRKELKSIQDGKNTNVSAQIVGDDAFKWQVTINGEDETPYAGGTFFLSFEFPKNYPFSPPKVKFETKIYHMNVNDKGEACIAELKDSWSPALTMPQIVELIQKLMKTPETENPLNAEIAQLYKSDREAYNAACQEWVRKYAL